MYELDTRPAEQDPPNDYYAGALEYHFADRRDGQSHFARLMTYQMLPSYRRDAADLTGWRFREGYGATPHRCLPPADVMFGLAASQRTPQEYAGVTVIQRHSGGSGPHGALQRVKYPHLPRPRHPQTYTTSAWPLPLIAFGQEVNIDQDNQQEQPINLSLARSLYATPELDLVPVRMRSCDPVRPNVTWQAVRS